MKTLVLGGYGFIGRHIVQTFADENMAIVVFDIHANPAHSTPHCTYVAGDFSDHDKIDALIAQHAITHVVHLVSTTVPKSSNEDKPYDVESNVIPTLHLLDLCVKYQVKRLLFMSSGGTVYGAPQQLPVDESHPTNPMCSYGISKLAIEKYLFLYRHLYGLNYVVLRAANPYGPGQNPLSGQGIVANFVHKMFSGQSIEVWGDGSNVRDYFYVRDLAAIARKALFSEVIGVFNVGSGVGISVNDIISMIARAGNFTPSVIYKEKRLLDVPSVVLNCNHAKNNFDWVPLTSINQGIEEYLSWYRLDFLPKAFQGMPMKK
jgi:UDP-glucose 4-epimerase